ncbi:putative pre-16S rRNA nuclease [Bacteroidia bacterium]|nr:putative pre-16S rRNA nuclease [Bacteroidia bacterium]
MKYGVKRGATARVSLINKLIVGRILAVDYGKKRVGIAVTDPGQMIANGLQTVLSNEVFLFLERYLNTEKVDLFVVGYPKQMNNQESESMVYIRPFVRGLKRKFPDIPVEMYDERFTSVMAHKALIEGGFKKKTREDKAGIDTMSATILLTSYLEYLKR